MNLRTAIFLMLSLFVTLAFMDKDMDKGKPTYPGFLIWNDGIKETANIQPGSITDNEVKIKYLVGKKVITIKPDKLKSYGYTKKVANNTGENFHYDRLEMPYPAKPFAGNTAMVLREVTGPLTLYSYFVEVRTDRKNPVQHRPHVKTEQGKLIEIHQENFKKELGLLFKDYRALHKRIGTKGFELKNLRRMVRDYNYWKTRGHNGEIYKVSPENWDGENHTSSDE